MTECDPANPGLPIDGFYIMRLVKRGPWVPVRIWFGSSFDPATGEWCDRSYLWRCCIDGEQRNIWEAWPACSGEPITAAEYRYRRQRSLHMRQHEPDQPEARPRRPVDYGTVRYDF